MKVILPECHKDITLRQYQEYALLQERKDLNKFEYQKRKVRIFTGLTYAQVEKMQQADYEEFLQLIDTALLKENEFTDRFTMYEKTFGFIPNFDELKAKEYFDLMEYGVEDDTLHKLMAILFRPITNEVARNGYEIMEYNGTKEYAELMKDMPIHVVNGALVFFWTLASELLTCTLKSSSEERLKVAQQVTTLKSGGGMRRLTDWLTGSRGSTKK